MQGKYSYRIWPMSITASLSDEAVNQEGNVIAHLEGTAVVGVKLNDRSNSIIPLGPGDSIELPPGFTFNRFFVSYLQGLDTVKLLVARPGLRMRAGQVNVSGSVNVGRNDKSYHANSL